MSTSLNIFEEKRSIRYLTGLCDYCKSQLATLCLKELHNCMITEQPCWLLLAPPVLAALVNLNLPLNERHNENQPAQQTPTITYRTDLEDSPFPTTNKSCSFFFLTVWHGILVPQPGIELMAPAMEAWNLHHWTTKESPKAYPNLNLHGQAPFLASHETLSGSLYFYGGLCFRP